MSIIANLPITEVEGHYQKKDHTVKNVLLVNALLLILFLSALLLDSGVLGFHVVHESQLIYKVIEKEGL